MQRHTNSLNRVSRIIGYLSVTLITLVVLLVVGLVWSGKRRWATTQAAAQKEHESLNFRSLLPETPPATENLLTIPALDNIAQVLDGDPAKGEPGAKRKALDLLKQAAANAKPPATHGVLVGKSSSLQGWLQYMVQSQLFALPNSTPSAQEALAALDAKFPVGRELAETCLKRPQAAFTPGIRDRQLPEMLVTMPLHHCNIGVNLGRLLTLRARLASAAGDTPSATHSILALLRMADAYNREPTLITFLVACSLQALAQEAIWQGLQERTFADADLALLQKTLEATDVTSAMLDAMRGELAIGVTTIDCLQNGPTAENTSAETAQAMGTITKLPSGLLDHYKSAMVELELKHFIVPLKQSGLMAVAQSAAELEGILAQKSHFLLHWDTLFVRLFTTSAHAVTLRALATEARRRQAIVALALERFLVKEHRYPAQLTELCPVFLSSLPQDPCDGQPLRYSPLPERYRLWSIGIDAQDDNGHIGATESDASKIHKREYRGDWTWQYEASQRP